MASSDSNRPTRKAADSNEMAETNVPASGSEMAETNVGGNSGGDPDATFVGDPSQQTQANSEESQPAAQKPAASSAKPASGKKKVSQLGDFKILKKLGQGGMGTVYLATQISLDRKVALKTLSKEFAQNPDFVKRFLREARSMAKLQHQNVVQVYAADSASGVHYAAIEFIDGQSMQDWMDQKKKLSIADALHVVLVAADALRHAFELKLIHRDIKPDNILVTKKGTVKGADFGLAKAIDEDVSMTQSGTGLGTPLYMAPEQARNAKHVDQRSAISALGSTLYYFLTGQLPFTGENTLELIMAKEKGQCTSARRLNPEIPERLDLMIDKMMAKDPAHRYDDYNKIIGDLQSLKLAGQSLSFAEAGGSTSVMGASIPGGRTTAASSGSKRSAQAVSSAEDAARTQAQQASKTMVEKMWFVRHTNAQGKLTVSKMNTSQVMRGLKMETLDLKTKAKTSAKGAFLPLAQYPDFESAMQGKVVKAQANARSQGMKSAFAKIDKQEKRRKRWRWFWNMLAAIKGGIGLIIWLAIIGAVIGAGYLFGWPYIKELINK